MRKTNFKWAAAFVAALGSVGAAQPASATVTDVVTLTNGAKTGTCSSVLSGYSEPYFGSLSPNVLPGGKTVYAFAENASYGGCQTFSALTIYPAAGAIWLISISCDNGYTKYGTDATWSYNYVGATYSTWKWLTTFRFDQVALGGQVICSITHL